MSTDEERKKVWLADLVLNDKTAKNPNSVLDYAKVPELFRSRVREVQERLKSLQRGSAAHESELRKEAKAISKEKYNWLFVKRDGTVDVIHKAKRKRILYCYLNNMAYPDVEEGDTWDIREWRKKESVPDDDDDDDDDDDERKLRLRETSLKMQVESLEDRNMINVRSAEDRMKVSERQIMELEGTLGREREEHKYNVANLTSQLTQARNGADKLQRTLEEQKELSMKNQLREREAAKLLQSELEIITAEKRKVEEQLRQAEEEAADQLKRQRDEWTEEQNRHTAEMTLREREAAELLQSELGKITAEKTKVEEQLRQAEEKAGRLKGQQDEWTEEQNRRTMEVNEKTKLLECANEEKQRLQDLELSHQREKMQLQGQLKELREKLAQEKEAAAAEKKNASDAIKANEAIKARVERMSEVLRTIREQVEKQTATISEQKSELDQCKVELSNLRQAEVEVRKLKEQNQAISLERDALETERNSMETNLACKQREVDRQRGELEAKEQKMAEVGNEIERLTTVVHRLTNENEQLTSDVNELGNALQESEDEKIRLKAELENRGNWNCYFQKEVDRITLGWTELQNKLQATTQEKADLKVDLENQLAETAAAKGEVDQLNDSLSNARGEIQKYREENAALEQSLTEKAGELEKVKFKLATAVQQTSKHEEENTQLRSKMTNVQKQLDMKSREMHKLELEAKNGLRSENKSLVEARTSLQSNVVELETKRDELKNQLNCEKNLVARLENANRELEESNDRQKDLLTTKEQESTKAKAEISRLTPQLLQQQSSYGQLQSVRESENLESVLQNTRREVRQLQRNLSSTQRRVTLSLEQRPKRHSSPELGSDDSNRRRLSEQSEGSDFSLVTHIKFDGNDHHPVSSEHRSGEVIDEELAELQQRYPAATAAAPPAQKRKSGVASLVVSNDESGGDADDDVFGGDNDDDFETNVDLLHQNGSSALQHPSVDDKGHDSHVVSENPGDGTRQDAMTRQQDFKGKNAPFKNIKFLSPTELKRQACGECYMCKRLDCGKCQVCIDNADRPESECDKVCLRRMCEKLGLREKHQAAPGLPTCFRIAFVPHKNNPRANIRQSFLSSSKEGKEMFNFSLRSLLNSRRSGVSDIDTARVLRYIGAEDDTGDESEHVLIGFCTLHQFVDVHGKRREIQGRVSEYDASEDAEEKFTCCQVDFSDEARKAASCVDDDGCFILPKSTRMNTELCLGGCHLHSKRIGGETGSIPSTPCPWKWLVPDKYKEDTYMSADGERFPRLCMEYDGFEITLSVAPSNTAGRGVAIRVTSLDGNKKRKLQLNPGELLDFGTYPAHELHRMLEYLFDMKNFMFNSKCEEYAFQSPESGFVFDITDDKTGEVDDRASRRIHAFVNESLDDNPDVIALTGPDNSIHFLLGSLHKTLSIPADGKDREIFVYYGPDYEGQRIRSGYSQLAPDEIEEGEKKLKTEGPDYIQNLDKLSRSEVDDHVTNWQKRYPVRECYPEDLTCIRRIFLVALSLYKRAQTFDSPQTVPSMARKLVQFLLNLLADYESDKACLPEWEKLFDEGEIGFLRRAVAQKLDIDLI